MIFYNLVLNVWIFHHVNPIQSLKFLPKDGRRSTEIKLKLSRITVVLEPPSGGGGFGRWYVYTTGIIYTILYAILIRLLN